MTLRTPRRTLFNTNIKSPSRDSLKNTRRSIAFDPLSNRRGPHIMYFLAFPILITVLFCVRPIKCRWNRSFKC